jgi:general secretion pathway protein C
MFPLYAQGQGTALAGIAVFTIALADSIILAERHRQVQMAHFLRGVGNRLGLSAAALPRLCTVLLVLALAAAITGWVLELSALRTPAEPVRAVPLGNTAARTQAEDIAPVAQLFGARAGREGSDIKLVGVIALGKQGQGIALLAVDGQPALALRAGEEIVAGITLSEVRGDRVLLNRSGASQEIRLPVKAAVEGITRVPN